MHRFVASVGASALGVSLAASAIVAQPLPSPAIAAESDTTDTPTVEWQRLWHPAFKPRMGAGTSLHNVQRVGDRFAIVGSDDRGAVVWWSEDGTDWRRTRRTDATERGVGVSIAGEPGGYVMVGHQWTPTPRGRIWHSVDGRKWTPAATKLPPGSEALSVVKLNDGSFAAYGYDGRRAGCWMGTSADGGANWDFRWSGDWDPGKRGACATSVVNDGDVLLAKIYLDRISESTDGITWRELVSAKEIRQARPRSTKRYIDAGLLPLGDGRFALGGKGTRTLIWSREGGLERIVGPIDWSRHRPVGLAVGDERSVAVRRTLPVPLVDPPTKAYAERWTLPRPVCRPLQPTIDDLAAMTPAERLDCHGGRELTFEAWIPAREYGGTCPFGPPFTWMLCEDYWLASGPGASPGWFQYAFAPGARVDKGADNWGRHVRVTGHFDDPAARDCPAPDWDGQLPAGWRKMTRADFVTECRQRFVVTEMRRLPD